MVGRALLLTRKYTLRLQFIFILLDYSWLYTEVTFTWNLQFPFSDQPLSFERLTKTLALTPLCVTIVVRLVWSQYGLIITMLPGDVANICNSNTWREENQELKAGYSIANLRPAWVTWSTVWKSKQVQNGGTHFWTQLWEREAGWSQEKRKMNKKSWAWWHRLVLPTTWGSKTGGFPSSRPTWAI